MFSRGQQSAFQVPKQNIYTIASISHREHRPICLVKTQSVFARNFVGDWWTKFRDIVGGKSGPYTHLTEDLTDELINGLCEEAEAVSANGLIDVNISLTNMRGKFIVGVATATATQFQT